MLRSPPPWANSHALEGCPLQRLQSFVYAPTDSDTTTPPDGRDTWTHTEQSTPQLAARQKDEPLRSPPPPPMAFTVGAEPKIVIFPNADGLEHSACSLALAHYVLRQRRELVCHNRVLQLGCGTGLAGIAASRAGACRVHLTDGSTEAVELARRSVAASGVQDNTEVSQLRLGQSVDGAYDVCLALDVCLSGHTLDGLVHTLNSVLNSSSTTHHPMAVVAWRRQDPRAERRVLDELRCHFDITVMADLPCLPHDAVRPLERSYSDRFNPSNLAASALVFLRLEHKSRVAQKRPQLTINVDEGRPIRRHASLP